MQSLLEDLKSPSDSTVMRHCLMVGVFPIIIKIVTLKQRVKQHLITHLQNSYRTPMHRRTPLLAHLHASVDLLSV